MKVNIHLFHRALGIVALAFGTLLSSCTQEIPVDNPGDEGVEMVINVGNDTRTTNSGDQTLWDADDVLTVIHTSDGSEFWASPFQNSGGNAFTGKVKRLSATNDWYVIYPYLEENVAANQINFTFPSSQTQTANGSMSHLAGEEFPLYGKKTGVARTEALSMPMQNLLAVAGFKVKNELQDSNRSIIVKEVQFTAPVQVSGSFSVDLTGDAPVFTAGSGATKTVKLAVNNGSAIEKGAESWFYVAVAPFEAPAGSKLQLKTVAVYADAPNTEIVFYRTIDLTDATSFNSGVIKTVGVPFDEKHTTNPDAGTAGEVELEVGEEPEDGDYLLVYEDGENSYAFAAFADKEADNYSIPVTVVDGVVLPQDGLDLSIYAVTIEVATDANNNPIEHPNDAGHYAYNVRNSDGKYIFYASGGGDTKILRIQDTNQLYNTSSQQTVTYYHTFIQEEDGVQILSSGGVSGYNKYLLTYSEAKGFHYSNDSADQGKKLHLYLVGGTVKEKQHPYFDPDTVPYDFDNPSDFPEPELKDAYTPVISWASNNESVATVDENGNVTIHKAGSAKITATLDSNDTYYSATAEYTISATSSEGQTFYLVTEIEVPGQYLIVSGGMALTNNGGTIGATSVSPANGEVTVTDATSLVWTAAEASNGYTFSNDGYYVQRGSSSGSNGKPSITKSPNSSYNYWNYDGSKLYNGTSSAYYSSFYYLYYSSSSWAQTSSSSSAGTVTLYSANKPLTAQDISFTEDPVIKVWGEDCIEGATIPVQTVSNAQTSVTYESSNSNVATISGTTITVVGKGSTTITATAKEENGFKKATATYSLHITDPAPAGFKHLGFFNLENDAVREYLDRAELEYTDDNITELSFVKTYYSKYYSSTNRTDIPKPVTISWDKASSGSAIIKIYLDKNNDLNLDSNEMVWTQTASSGSKLSYVYNLIPGKTYYCTVEDDSGNLLKGVFGTTGRRRMMRISDSSNASTSANYGSNCRDLGGLKTTNGKRIKYGMIYRGTNLTNTSKEERAFMVNYMNIGLDNDLRSGSGGGSSRDDPFHSTSNGHVDYGTDVVYCGPGYGGTGDLQTASKFKQTMKAFINCAIRGKASYFHCYIGSDRTGYTGLMLEGLLGVTANDCSIDYEMTTFASNITGDRTRNGSKGGDSMYYFGSARTFLDGLSYNKQGNLTLQQKVINYLITGLEITQEEIDAFFEAVLEDDPDL